jgi:hypothetical protein
MHTTSPDDSHEGELRPTTASPTPNIDIMSAPRSRRLLRSPEQLSIVWEHSPDDGAEEALLQALEMLLPPFSRRELGALDESEATTDKGRV